MLKVYNTLTRKKEVFRARRGKMVKLFVCGVTPYDFSHIGHARTYLAFDMLAKYLKEKEYDVFYLQNITDIDDKIIKRAKEKRITPKKLASFFEKEYLKDMKNGLKIDSVTKYARATDYIKEIISQIEKLLNKGFAYKIKGGIYYDIKKFKDYGKLSRRTVEGAEDAVSRIDESKEKRNKGDFCLWKTSKPGEPKWRPAPSGRGSPSLPAGRPGWHIEDTAIAEKFFGTQYDIHGGANELIFPHHEAEISQMEAISGKKPMVKYWLHTGLLTIGGKKMAKSLGNFITVKDFNKKYSPRLLRFLILKNHYRSPIDYNESAVVQAKRELTRIDEFTEKLQITNPKSQINSKLQFSKFEKEFDEAMEDDFNTPKAVAVIFELINQGNSLIKQSLLSKTDARNILQFLKKIDRIFNFIFWQKSKTCLPAGREKIKLFSLAKQRQKYREQSQWQKADEIRKKIKEMGYWIEDTKQGSKIKKLSS